MNDEIYKKVANQLRTMTPVKIGSVPISPDTEIYADLKIYGDDLFEFLIWIKNQFGVQVTVAGGKYAPSEGPFLKVVKALTTIINGKTHPYKSLKIRDVVNAIDTGGTQFD